MLIFPSRNCITVPWKIRELWLSPRSQITTVGHTYVFCIEIVRIIQAHVVDSVLWNVVTAERGDRQERCVESSLQFPGVLRLHGCRTIVIFGNAVRFDCQASIGRLNNGGVHEGMRPLQFKSGGPRSD